MCSTFSYLPIIFFRCCLTPWFYRGHYITTPNTAQTYRVNPSNFIPPKKIGDPIWSSLLFFRGTKNPKIPGYRGHPRPFLQCPRRAGSQWWCLWHCRPHSRSCPPFKLNLKIQQQFHTPKKKTWTSMDTSDTPKMIGLLEKWWKNAMYWLFFGGYLC